MKADLLRGRLAVTAAAFQISQTQVPEADVLGFYRQIGEGESEGLELEVVGSPAPRARRARRLCLHPHRDHARHARVLPGVDPARPEADQLRSLARRGR